MQAGRQANKPDTQLAQFCQAIQSRRHRFGSEHIAVRREHASIDSDDCFFRRDDRSPARINPDLTVRRQLRERLEF